MSEAPYRSVAFGPYEAEIARRHDGCTLLRARAPLGEHPARFTSHLLHWAGRRPAHTFLAQRGDAPGRPWMHLTYAQTLDHVRALAQALLDAGLSPERPLMVLSGNDTAHALLALAAMHVGIPVAPVSPSYSLLDPSAARVAQAVALITPGLVFAADGAAFGAAIAHALPRDVPVVLGRGTLGDRAAIAFDTMRATTPTPAVDAAHARVGGDTIAKFLFTSGSTKAPKAVVNTHRMLCANQQMYAQCYPFLEAIPPVLVDWLPWHHTAGGNSNLGLVLRNGGTMYIDDGKPTEDGIARTVANLREVAPTAIYTVPKGLEVLAEHLERDDALRVRVFSELRLIFAAGAAMPPSVIERIDRLAVRTIGSRIPMTMGLGMTETAPFAISHHRPGWQAGVIGLPAPGLDVKLAPVGDKLEVRYRGPSVTPGYWRQAELHAEAFDDEGFFRSGDAAAFIDPDDPERGLRFDGRIAEDFKLISGTWVNVGAMRARALAQAQPHVQDVVVAGDGRDSIGLLVFLAPGRNAADAGLRDWAQRWLDDLAAAGTGSSNRIERALLLDTPPSAALGELTDKGSINQRRVLALRADAVQALYAEPADARVLRAARMPLTDRARA